MKTPFDIVDDLTLFEATTRAIREGMIYPAPLEEDEPGFWFEYSIVESDLVRSLNGRFACVMRVGDMEFVGEEASPEAAHLACLDEIGRYAKALAVILSWPRPETPALCEECQEPLTGPHDPACKIGGTAQ